MQFSRKILVLFLALISGMVSLSAQDQEYEIVGYSPVDSTASSPVVVKKQEQVVVPVGTKRPPGLRQRNVGRALALGGVAMFAGGVMLINQADPPVTRNGYTQYDYRETLGSLMVTGSLGMIIPGVILWSKGAKRYNRYLEKQSLSLHFEGAYPALCYRF
jgi:hypothetical protein